MGSGNGSADPEAGLAVRRRKWVLAGLACNGALVSFLGYVTARRIFEPMMSVPPNRFFAPTPTQMAAAAVAMGNYTFGWLLLLIGAIVGILTWKGRLDALSRAILALLLISCVGNLTCILYSESIPSWVERHHGSRARERMYGPR